MNIQNKTILVTGGGAGIGFAIAKKLSGNGNSLILAGRRENVLKEAVAQLPNATYIVTDVTKDADVDNLVKQVKAKFGGLDILVNNAGTGFYYQLDSDAGKAYENARLEIELNYLSVVNLTERFLPFLKASKDAAIINVESIVSYLPAISLPTYSATKAALHSYALALRLTLEQSNPHIKVFEVFPPYVDTDLTKGIEAEKITAEEVAQDLYNALQKNEYAVRNGITKDVYVAYRQSPEDFLKVFNQIEA
ncbi:hypothetical protein A4H97_19785 [Niastella yeongjuensis]|uniref:Short-chain dehydrogenase n=1 Tax=Niastella yeongjuensis TaxID=354355 RepID=A0A1V9FC39_9BACT|nr:SDR family NAD(P)-dependent oxidoreductase [Niastella yeongjuensis]OQP55841.1 hypothetical protein A4H97_19785 [Niastella yeongjuensis]SEP47357.1 uncharacterized oxidoreductase [Niastella yeongjuensis]